MDFAHKQLALCVLSSIRRMMATWSHRLPDLAFSLAHPSVVSRHHFGRYSRI